MKPKKKKKIKEWECTCIKEKRAYFCPIHGGEDGEGYLCASSTKIKPSNTPRDFVKNPPKKVNKYEERKDILRKKIKCDLCGKSIEELKACVLETSCYRDLIMCKECALEARKLVRKELRT